MRSAAAYTLRYHACVPNETTRMPRLLLPTLLAALLATGLPAFAASPVLTTLAERSGFRETGRYDEVIALCDAFAKAYPDAVHCTDFGTTPEGRPMKMLVVSQAGVFTPEAARAKRIPVLLVQGGIHAGEIDGKDAGFLALRQVLNGQAATGSLKRQVFLFVPVFNVDGHERFGAWNRPNQRGPAEMGWRTTAQNLNLNRDYVKVDAPEMQAMLRLVDAWDPLAYVDLHVTDGAKFQHDVSVQVEPVHAGDPTLRKAGIALRDGVIARLDAQGSMALPFYPSFIEADNPQSGFEDGVSPPRFSSGYFQLRNRFGMLVETHSWKDYPTRVRVTRNATLALLELVATNGTQWLQLAHAADARSTHLAATQVALDYKAGPKAHTIDFEGYAYTRTPSEVSGGLMTHYDETKPETWHVPLHDDVQPSVVVTAPSSGYLVPAAHAAWVGEKLKQHGIEYRRLDHAMTAVRVDVFRSSAASFAGQSFEGHQRLTVTGSWAPDMIDLVAGALFVPIAQPKARLAMELLEPQAPDSLLAWGEFNNAFEQKEYMEPYVAEEVARAMLSRDPQLKSAFERRLKDDPGFAKDPQARLDFFYQRHASWDQRYRMYPVLRALRDPD